jgi:hypothetical protein
MTCVDCECRSGESGAVDVRNRSLGGYVEPRCVECFLFAEDNDAADRADERAFYA